LRPQQYLLARNTFSKVEFRCMSEKPDSPAEVVRAISPSTIRAFFTNVKGRAAPSGLKEMTYTQDNRPGRLTTALGKDILLLTSFTATEEISNPFEIQHRLRQRESADRF